MLRLARSRRVWSCSIGLSGSLWGLQRTSFGFNRLYDDLSAFFTLGLVSFHRKDLRVSNVLLGRLNSGFTDDLTQEVSQSPKQTIATERQTRYGSNVTTSKRR